MNKNPLKKTLATLLTSVSLMGCNIEQTPAQTAQALAVDSRVPVRCSWEETEYDWCQLLDFDGDQHVDVVEDGMKNALFAVPGAGEKIGAYPLFYDDAKAITPALQQQFDDAYRAGRGAAHAITQAYTLR
jgi:S-adenosylhomocysteine hydrolase